MDQKKIIHIDMDAFYASIELRDNPSLRGCPIAVGGDSNRGGVIATADYSARKFGVRSAMPSWKAKQLCPDLLIIRPNFEKYQEESRAIQDIFHSFTDMIEPLSLDEAYLDVSDAECCQGSATLIAQEIKRRIAEERRLTASAGAAPNKFLAKVASDWSKPDGLFVIPPEDVEAFVKDLPVERISGIGRVTAKKLHLLDVETCGDLQEWEIGRLQRHFGARAWGLYEQCRGIDSRPVQSERMRKSISVETTFFHDLETVDACLEQVPELYRRLMARMEKIKSPYRFKKPFVKVKFSDFTSTTAESAFCSPFALSSYEELIELAWERKKLPVRLLGLGAALSCREETQLTLF
jgi:DNA polymerase-4